MPYNTPNLAEMVILSIAQHTGSEPQTIELLADLEEDLGLFDQDLVQVLTLLNRQFEELHLTRRNRDKRSSYRRRPRTTHRRRTGLCLIIMLPTFTDSQLLERALTHRSALNERGSAKKHSYERLEYLGDAVLELAVSDFYSPNSPQNQRAHSLAIGVRWSRLKHSQ